MKLKIKVREITEGCLPKIIKKGDWIDLRTAKNIELNAPQAGIQYQTNGVKYRDVRNSVELIPLGVAMELPKGFEAHMLPRSSTSKKWKIIQANSEGIIDNTFCGNEDEWKFPALAFDSTSIPKGTRICQFRIQLSQNATFWQKIKWFLCSGVKIVKVEKLKGKNRKGIGSTGD